MEFVIRKKNEDGIMLKLDEYEIRSCENIKQLDLRLDNILNLPIISTMYRKRSF